MATLKHIASVARAAALFNHKPHICDIQFDVVANDLNNRIVIKTRTTPPSKRTSFTSTMRSLESNFWMSTASRSCENRTSSIHLSAAIFRLQRPVCWQTASMVRIPSIDESYDVPQKFLELYYRLHNAESLMRKSWEVTFDLNPKLLTHPEQVKVLRFALKPHLEFLKTLGEVLAESSGKSSKTA